MTWIRTIVLGRPLAVASKAQGMFLLLPSIKLIDRSWALYWPSAPSELG